MRQRKSPTQSQQYEQTDTLVGKEGCDEQKKSWWSSLKYLVVLVVPAFLNHAALYREASVLKPFGELYDIGWRQKLFMSCSGHGPPTVILDSPTGKSSDAWAVIAPEIAKVAKTCVYDRAGLGFSDKPFVNWSDSEQEYSKRGKPSTSERMVEDFHHLFTSSSNPPGPFILVGAELGAVNMRFYTQVFENNVASLVLINPLVEGMFNDDWSKQWFEEYVSSHQALQFSAAVGITRIALILGLMKVPMRHKSVPVNVTTRQKYLLCKPGHLSSGVDELFFANESLAQMRTVWRVKPFPSAVDVSIVTSGSFSYNSPSKLNQVWSSAQDHISKTLHPGSERVHISGNAESALLQNSETIVKIIKKHVYSWKQRNIRPKTH